MMNMKTQKIVFSVTSITEQTGFENGMQFAIKLLFSLLNIRVNQSFLKFCFFYQHYRVLFYP